MTQRPENEKTCAAAAALVVFALAMSPARASAETLELVCVSPSGTEWHVSVDTDKREVRESLMGNARGPFDASISDTFIRWTSPGITDHTNAIDRTTGTFTETWNNGYNTSSGKCRIAANKF